MSHESMPTDEPDRRGIPRWMLIAGGVLLLILVLVLASVALGGRDGSPSAAGTSKPTTGATPTPSETPALPDSTATPETTPDAAATTPASPEPTEGPAAEAPAAGTAAAPAPLDAPSQAVPGVTISIAELAAVEGEPRGAGELAGPALRFAVNVANTGDATASLGTVVVNLYYGENETPAPPVHGPNGADLPAEVAAGSTVSGAYVFTVPEDERDRVRIEVDYSTEAGVVVFEGSAPR